MAFSDFLYVVVCAFFALLYVYECFNAYFYSFVLSRLLRVYETRWEIYHFSSVLVRTFVCCLWTQVFLVCTVFISHHYFALFVVVLLRFAESCRCLCVAYQRIPEKSPKTSWDILVEDNYGASDTSSEYDADSESESSSSGSLAIRSSDGRRLAHSEVVYDLQPRLRRHNILSEDNKITDLGMSDGHQSDSEAYSLTPLTLEDLDSLAASTTTGVLHTDPDRSVFGNRGRTACPVGGDLPNDGGALDAHYRDLDYSRFDQKEPEDISSGYLDLIRRCSCRVLPAYAESSSESELDIS